MIKTLTTILFGILLATVSLSVMADNDQLSDDYVKIGLLTSFSGPYKTVEGPGSKVAAEMAIEDFGGTVLGHPIKLISADTQMKADVASTIARRWIDAKNVDTIVGLGSSAVAQAVQELAGQKKVITINSGAATDQLTEEQCTRYGVDYTLGTYASSVGLASAVVKGGSDNWFFITVDYAFGHSARDNATRVINELGGTVVGDVTYPLGTTDFASYLIKAKSSGADVIALANAGSDTINTIKQAHAFKIPQSGQNIVALFLFITDVKALGLDVAQGLKFTTAFYWDRNEETNAWSKRFFERHGAMPTQDQAGVYGSVLTYLNAVERAKTDESDAVRAALGKLKINNVFTSNGYILPNGRMVHDMYLAEVKSPDASSGPWDLMKIIKTIPGKKAFKTKSESSCHLLENN